MSKLDQRTTKLLKGKNFAFVATINRDGVPQLTPTWIDTDGTNVLVNTALGRTKERNVARDKRVTVGLLDHSNPYDRVTIEGKVVKEIRGKEAEDHIDKLSYKYTGNKKYAGRTPSEKRVIFVIEPVKVY